MIGLEFGRQAARCGKGAELQTVQRTIIAMTLKTLIAAAGAAFALIGAATAASAATPWQAHHPRRVEVNMRLERETLRIDHARHLGRITPAGARRLYLADLRVREQERWFALHHRSHLTRAEQIRLNHAETRLSHRIG